MQNEKKELMESATEGIGFFQIVLSPFLLGAVAGGIVYGVKPDSIGLTIAIALAVLGLIIGAAWAFSISKKNRNNAFCIENGRFSRIG